MKKIASILALSVLLSAAGSRALGDSTPAKAGQLFESTRIEAKPQEMQGVGITEKLNSRLPLEASFYNEANQRVQLSDYFRGERPVILQMGYMSCPMLCDLVSRGTADSLGSLDLELGKDYEVIYLSIDPNEKADLAAKKKQTYIANYSAAKKLDDAGTAKAAGAWHVLTGDEDSIRKVADVIGFNYKWIPTPGGAQSEGQYSHPAVITLITPSGTVSRYLYGVAFDKKLLRLSLVETSEGKVSSAMDQILLTCFHYDAKTHQYTLAATRLMQLGGVVTVLCLVSTLGLFQLRSRSMRGIARRNTGRGLSAVLNSTSPISSQPSSPGKN